MPHGPLLLLITASSPEIQRVRRSRVLNFQQITMPYLGAFVPPHWTVRHVDEAVERVDLEASADEVAKGFNRVDEYARAIERIDAHGIAVQAGIVFGFDHDTEAVFDETLEFLETAGVQNATFNILTPFPGTRLHQRLEAEGRILTRDWSRYNGRADVVYQPRHMSPDALLRGYRRANRRFYSWRSIRRRLSRSPVQLSWTLPLNLAYALALNRCS